MTEADPTPPNLNELRLGYQYRDVVEKAQDTKGLYNGAYSWAPNLTVSFSVRDMKYLSNSNDTKFYTENVDIMNGTKPIKASLNFNDLLTQDATGQTMFVVGGRAYYEITVEGEATGTFISKGFFDQAGYS